jgi:hypothetical protein
MPGLSSRAAKQCIKQDVLRSVRDWQVLAVCWQLVVHVVRCRQLLQRNWGICVPGLPNRNVLASFDWEHHVQPVRYRILCKHPRADAVPAVRYPVCVGTKIHRSQLHSLNEPRVLVLQALRLQNRKDKQRQLVPSLWLVRLHPMPIIWQRLRAPHAGIQLQNMQHPELRRNAWHVQAGPMPFSARAVLAQRHVLVRQMPWMQLSPVRQELGLL